MKKNYTHIVVVLDKSGSMTSCLKDTVGGFNGFLKTQKEVEGEATITLVQFNGDYHMMMDMLPLSGAEDLTKKNYNPDGGTALLDAIGRTINNVESKIDDKPENEKPEKVIFVIITDGEENASKEFTKAQIMQMINNHRSEQKWEFVFIGANQDAIQAGNGIGVRASNSLGYDASGEGTKTMYASLTKSMTSYRCCADTTEKDFFSDEDRKAQENLNPKDQFLKNPKGMFQNMNIYSGTTANQKDTK